MNKRHTNILGPVDNAFLHVETEKTPMNIGAITIFEGIISYEDVIELLEARIHRAPIYKKRLYQSPLNLGELIWVFDPDFNVENHVYAIELDPPGTEEQLRELAGQLMCGMLNRQKPLWEVYIISGLEGNNTAFFFKVHHCMVDGLAAVELFTLLLDLTPEIPSLDEKRPIFNPPPLPTSPQMLVNAVRNEVPQKWKTIRKLGSDALYMGSVFLDKEKRRKALYGIVNLLNDNLQLIDGLAINGKNSGEMTVAWAEFPLAEVRAIKSSQGASVNDVMLYIFSTGIENYLVEHQDESDQEFLRVLVPVSMRADADKDGFGNRISVLPIDIPFEVSKPLEKLRKISEYSTVMKESSLSNAVDMVLTLPSLALPVFQPIIWGIAPSAFSFIAHTWCTNVAGPQIPVYLRGHRMLHSYGYFPLNPSMGLACVIMSYNQRITMTLIADRAIVPDVKNLRDHLQAAFQKLRKAAKVPDMEPFSPKKVSVPEKKTPSPPVAEVAPKASSDSPPAQAGAAPSSEPETPPTPQEAAAASSGRHILFSQDWATAYKDALNGNPDYKKHSLGWTAGSLAFIMHASPRHGHSKPSAVLLDLHKGVCRDAQAVAPQEAKAQATFVIEGDYENWLKLLRGQAKPLPMIMRGALSLKKGSISKLLPYTKSAQELMTSAQKVPTK